MELFICTFDISKNVIFKCQSKKMVKKYKKYFLKLPVLYCVSHFDITKFFTGQTFFASFCIRMHGTHKRQKKQKLQQSYKHIKLSLVKLEGNTNENTIQKIRTTIIRNPRSAHTSRKIMTTKILLMFPGTEIICKYFIISQDNTCVYFNILH